MSDKKFNDYLFQQFLKNNISRRKFMGTLAAAGASSTVINGLLTKRAYAATPKKGGRLVV